jgi:transposase-like protein
MKNDIETLPTNLMESIRYFSDPMVCLKTVAAAKWPNGPACPKCASKRLSFLQTRLMWKCLDCKKQFTVKVGTIFEDSPIPLDKWLTAMWMLANCKNGVSSYEIARTIQVTQKTAWFMLQRLRHAMHMQSIAKMAGEVEADETFIGGKARNMHREKREDKITGTGGKDKTAVLGFLERGGRVETEVVPNRKKATLQSMIKSHVSAGSALYTDALASYDGLNAEFFHQVVDHAVQYVRGRVHTNGLENFWSLLKRAIKGTYVSVEPFHLFRYLDEQSFRYNERKANDSERFQQALGSVAGKRLTWNTLTCQEVG